MKRGLSVFIILGMLFGFSFIIGCDNDGGGGGDGIDENDIGGTVMGSPGEAGVWVIAETDELPTKFRKIVVTDDDGNFVIPDLPDATYNVWVRGYGLKDSVPIQASPGEEIELNAEQASNPQEAAKVYPANSWFSLFRPPAKSLFPGTGTGEGGNGIPANFGSQDQWIADMKGGCELCHQEGTLPTRSHPTPQSYDLAWQLAGTMNAIANNLGRERAAQVFGAWGARIAAGDVPPQPRRPKGIERNVVITQWVWGDGQTYAHDEVATDKRDPSLYPNGKVYGVDLGNDFLLITDPVAHKSARIKVPTANGFDTAWCDQTFVGPGGGDPQPNGFCTLNLYDNPANPHNPMLDDTGKVWITTQIRREWTADFPDFCLDDPAIVGTPEAPRRHHRQLGYYDTVAKEFVLIDTCFGTHHLQFDFDGKLWLSGDSFVLGVFNPSKFDPNDPSTLERAQDWFEQIDSSSGEPVYGFLYGIIPNPADGSIWGATPSAGGEGPARLTNRILRFDPGTKTFDNYPLPPPGRGPRGVDATTDGRIWFGTISGHLGVFDRSKCADIHSECPEGFKFFRSPGPKFVGVGNETGSVDMHYYVWVDQFNTSGLGEDTVFLTGTGSDSIIAFDPNTEKFTAVFRMPYPLGFFHRGLDGRIDDPDTGWKGRGLWVDYGIDPVKHTETGIGQICNIQFRPDPLAH